MSNTIIEPEEEIIKRNAGGNKTTIDSSLPASNSGLGQDKIVFKLREDDSRVVQPISPQQRLSIDSSLADEINTIAGKSAPKQPTEKTGEISPINSADGNIYNQYQDLEEPVAKYQEEESQRLQRQHEAYMEEQKKFYDPEYQRQRMGRERQQMEEERSRFENPEYQEQLIEQRKKELAEEHEKWVQKASEGPVESDMELKRQAEYAEKRRQERILLSQDARKFNQLDGQQELLNDDVGSVPRETAKNPNNLKGQSRPGLEGDDSRTGAIQGDQNTRGRENSRPEVSDSQTNNEDAPKPPDSKTSDETSMDNPVEAPRKPNETTNRMAQSQTPANPDDRSQSVLNQHLGFVDKGKTKLNNYLQDSSIKKRLDKFTEAKQKARDQIMEKSGANKIKGKVDEAKQKARDQIMEKSGLNKIKQQAISKLAGRFPGSTQLIEKLASRTIIRSVLMAALPYIGWILLGILALAMIFGILGIIIVPFLDSKDDEREANTPMVDSAVYVAIEWFENMYGMATDEDKGNQSPTAFFTDECLQSLIDQINNLLAVDTDEDVQFYGQLALEAINTYKLIRTDEYAEKIKDAITALANQFYPCYKIARASTPVIGDGSVNMLSMLDSGQLLTSPYNIKDLSPVYAEKEENNVAVNNRACRFVIKIKQDHIIATPIKLEWFVSSPATGDIHDPSAPFNAPHHAGNAIDIKTSEGDILVEWLKNKKTELQKSGLFPLVLRGATTKYNIIQDPDDENMGKIVCRDDPAKDLSQCGIMPINGDLMHLEFPHKDSESMSANSNTPGNSNTP